MLQILTREDYDFRYFGFSIQEYVVEDRETNKDVSELDPSHVTELRMLGLYWGQHKFTSFVQLSVIQESWEISTHSIFVCFFFFLLFRKMEVLWISINCESSTMPPSVPELTAWSFRCVGIEDPGSEEFPWDQVSNYLLCLCTPLFKLHIGKVNINTFFYLYTEVVEKTYIW